jgi:SET domain-containing protein
MIPRKFKLYPSQEFLTVEGLEKKLSYRHTPLLKFETIQDQEEIRLKGVEQERKGEISSTTLDLGRQYHPQILSSYIPEVSIRYVHEAIGYGLFAEEPILENQYIGEYTGVVRRNDRRYFEPLNNYCYEYPTADEIGRSYVIDAKEGCLTRFINHQESPNLKALYAYWEGYYHLIFLALYPIKPGEQLSFDYGESYWYLRGKPVQIKS